MNNCEISVVLSYWRPDVIRFRHDFWEHTGESSEVYNSEKIVLQGRINKQCESGI